MMENEDEMIRLISGDAGPAERERLAEEIRGKEQQRSEFEKIKNAWALASSQKEMDPLSMERSWLKFRNRQLHLSRSAELRRIFSYAAILLLVLALGVYIGQLQNPQDDVMLSENTVREVHVPNGKQAEVVLNDGSRVWLNSGTTLAYSGTDDRKARKVSLTGEAFFEVQKGKLPFVVSSPYGEIKVLGTSFNVRAYDDMAFQATLTEGRILFRSGSAERTLSPGEQLSLDTGGEIQVRKVDVALASSWKEGVISFENEPLKEVVKKLEKHFDLTISLDPGLAPIRFTGKVFNEPVEEVLNYIGKTKAISYTYDKKTRTIRISGF